GPKSAPTIDPALPPSLPNAEKLSEQSALPQGWHNLADLIQQTAQSPASTVPISQPESRLSASTQMPTQKIKSLTQNNRPEKTKSKSPLNSTAKTGDARQALSKPRTQQRGTFKLPSRPSSRPVIQAKFEENAPKSGRDTLIQAKPEDPYIQLKGNDETETTTEPDSGTLEHLAHEVYGLLRQRLAIEQERHGARGYSGRFP
ncbi:MAG: hypothetical protein AAFW84_32685, partial [Cyanobacteria bacterium J06635_15]